jgi:5-methylcytosine-specific restriction protein A
LCVALLMSLLKHLKDIHQGKAKPGQKRSNQWPTIRKHFLIKNPVCSVCGGKKKLEVHHKMPFHMDPSKELDPHNLITLCEEDTDGVNCHLLFGHLGNFKSLNSHVEVDSKVWAEKIAKRPKGNE